MLMLAELLSQAGFEATFINSNHIQHRLEHSTNIATMYCRFPKFQFRSVPDGLPSDHPRSGSSIYQLLNSTRGATRTEFRNLLVNLGQKNGRWEPPTCIIADGIMSFAIDIAEELTIPIITSRTFSACCTWTYFHLTKLIEEGEVPFQVVLELFRFMDTRSKTHAEFHVEVHEALARHDTNFDELNHNFSRVSDALQGVMAELQAMRIAQSNRTLDREVNPFAVGDNSHDRPSASNTSSFDRNHTNLKLNFPTYAGEGEDLT